MGLGPHVGYRGGHARGPLDVLLERLLVEDLDVLSGDLDGPGTGPRALALSCCNHVLALPGPVGSVRARAINRPPSGRVERNAVRHARLALRGDLNRAPLDAAGVRWGLRGS